MNTVHVDSPQKTLGWNCAQNPTAKMCPNPKRSSSRMAQEGPRRNTALRAVARKLAKESPVDTRSGRRSSTNTNGDWRQVSCPHTTMSSAHIRPTKKARPKPRLVRMRNLRRAPRRRTAHRFNDLLRERRNIFRLAARYELAVLHHF